MNVIVIIVVTVDYLYYITVLVVSVVVTLFVLQVNTEHSYAMVQVFNEDVLEDLFETSMKRNTRLCKPSDVCCYQSTQVSRSDVPDGTIVIQPDFPVSPLQCTAPAVPVISDCGIIFTSPMVHSAGGLCSEVEMLTVTAAQSRPTTTVRDCSAAQGELQLLSSRSSDVTLPSAVYDKVRNLFLMSDSEMYQNRLSDTLSSGDDTRQQIRSDGELLTEAICTIAVSSTGISSPLNSSYVDAGRMAYTESAVNILSEVSVANAADKAVVTTCTEDCMGQLHITNVCSLRTSADTSRTSRMPCNQFYMKSSFSSSSSKNTLKGGRNSFTKKTLTSSEDTSVNLPPLSGSKRKQSSCKETLHESDVLFKKTKKVKRDRKVRRLYKHNMLMEVSEEEEAQHENTDVCVSLYDDNVNAQTVRDKKCVKLVKNDDTDDISNYESVVSSCEIPSPISVPATVMAPASQAADNIEACNNPAVNSVNDVVASCQNVVDMAVEVSATQLSQCSVSAVTCTSAVSLPVPNDRCCRVSESVTSLSVVNSTAHVSSSKCLQFLNSPFISEMLNDAERPSNCVIDELLGSAERDADVAAVKKSHLSDKQLPLCVTERHRKDSTMKHTVNTETSLEALSVVAAESCHGSVVQHDDSSLVRSSPPRPSNDAVAGSSERNTPETTKLPIGLSSVSSTEARTDIISLPTNDVSNAGTVAGGSLQRSQSLTEFGCQSCSGTTDFKAVSFDNTVDLLLCSSFVNETGITKKRNLSRKKFRKQTSMTSRARTSSVGHNNVATVSHDVSSHRGLTSESGSKENMGSAAGLCISSQSTSESMSESLLCGQKQSGESYCLPNVTVSVCRLSAVGTPFPPSHSCSLQCRERCRVAEESLGYPPPSKKADSIESQAENHKDQLMQSERCLPSNLIASSKLNTSNTSRKEQSSEVLPAASGTSDVCTLPDAAVIHSTETESKQSSSLPSNGSSKLTLPTPKNSLTCYQPPNSFPSTAPVSNSSLVLAASQVQPNYDLIQVLIFYTF